MAVEFHIVRMHYRRPHLGFKIYQVSSTYTHGTYAFEVLWRKYVAEAARAFLGSLLYHDLDDVR